MVGRHAFRVSPSSSLPCSTCLSDLVLDERRVVPKVMELAYGLDKVLLDTIPKLEHGHDGLIFTCVDTPYVIGEDPNM